MTLSEAIEKLNELEKASYALGHAESILHTDGDTVAPKNSWKGRGKALAYLSELTYKQLVHPETGEILETILQHRDETDEITFRRAEIIKESYDELHVLPMEEYIACLRHIRIRAPETLYHSLMTAMIYVYIEEMGCERARTLGRAFLL